MRGWLGPALALAALLAAGCGGSGLGGEAPPEDAAPDTAAGDTGAPEDGLDDAAGDPDAADGAADDAAPGDAGPDAAADTAGDAPGGPVRRFVQEPTGLSTDFVFKGVWAGAPGQVVAVGNDGVIVARSAGGAWKVVQQGSGSELLNDVTGVAADDLWAVGKDGTLLRGGAAGFAAGGGCATAADCDDGDPCTVDACGGGECTHLSSGAKGCCGTRVAEYGWDDGTLQGWKVSEAVGGLTWQAFSYVAPGGVPRFTSPPSALYFGDPTKPAPDFDAGAVVAATVTSPPLVLPKTGTATLGFQVFMDTESGASYDTLTVEVSAPGGVAPVWSKAELATVPTPGFVPVEVDLSPWAGQAVSLRVRFDSVDSAGNFGEGVFLDDLAVDTSCEAPAAGSPFPTLWGAHATAPDDAWAVGLQGAIVHWDGARWRQVAGGDATPTWHGLHGSGDTLVLVGSGGAVLLRQDGGLVEVESPTSATLRGVHTLDGETFWAVGDAGTVLRGEGASWSPVSVPTAADLYAVHARSPFDAYAVGDGGTVLHWDGTFWSLVQGLPGTVTTTAFRAVHVAPDGTATITGDQGALIEGTATGGFTYLGNLAKNGFLNGIWGQAGTRIMVGDNSAIFRYDGAWAQDDAPSTQNLRAVWGSAPTSAFAVGLGGVILRFDGTNWTKLQSPTSAGLNAVWGSGPAEAYAAGAGGVILRWDGEAWTLLSSSTSANLRAVHARPGGDVWAVGAGGTVMRNAGLAWGAAPVDTIVYQDGSEGVVDQQLHAVWSLAADDAWAVGEEGQVLHWDGKTWKSVDPGFGITLRGLYADAADDVWAVGNEGHVIHWDGQAWTPVDTGSVATLYDVHGDGQGQVYVVGDIGTVLRLVVEPAE